MSPRHGPGRRVALRAAIGAITLLVLAGLGVDAYRMLDEESAQARLLVEDGQRALARNDRGHAVLAFERARWLAPRAGFVRAALAVAAVQDAEPLAQRVLRFVTAREWAAIATTSGWLAGVALAIVIARRRSGLLARAAFAAGGAFVVGLGGVMVSNASSLAVVTSGDEAALLAPYPGAAAVGPLHAGATVVLGPEHAGFVRVRGDDGLTGWVPQTSLETVVGSAAPRPPT
jgi:hypothetical protein